MIWQDLVIGCAQLVFVIALLPTLFGNEKPARATCAATAVACYAVAFAVVSLDFIWSTVTVSMCAMEWTIMTFQVRPVSFTISGDLYNAKFDEEK